MFALPAPRACHSLIIDQIYDSDYAHLLPKRDSLFSDDDDEEEEGEDGSADEDDEADKPTKVKVEEDGGAATEGKDRKGKRKMEERDLDELEAERRTRLEARYGIDGTRRNVRLFPFPLSSSLLGTLSISRTDGGTEEILVVTGAGLARSDPFASANAGAGAAATGTTSSSTPHAPFTTSHGVRPALSDPTRVRWINTVGGGGTACSGCGAETAQVQVWRRRRRVTCDARAV